MMHTENVTYRNILGVKVACFDWAGAFAFFENRINEGRFMKQGWLNANNSNITDTDPAYRTALQDFLILPDGVGVDIASKVAYGSKFPANLNGTDFIPGLLQHMKRPLKVALLGGGPGVAADTAQLFMQQIPHHEYRVISDGFFKPADLDGILGQLKEFHPDILLVAMGVPRQELFIDKHITAEHCTVASAVGALFDLHTGRVQRAPHWVRKIQMEWVHRLLQEPRRLAKRYLIGNPVFLWRVAKGWMKGEPR
ncbi:WecB/TagA/CpsF family glycosyltransferase [Brucella anthropi]|jgi:exopolysaccharide biosynthesis WecB/TagA/CpsF family protein|uniref:WecB/TagA/CpsF family glycosyltransferase n=1 Tax=Brucella anthropi TaxID=529 RepID=A0A8I0N5S7_BRUAN|nr:MULTISPECIES: WecB/TagA/CpsF family glycosyltransferase [Brucella/Ochrobactrum group]MCR5942459.1 WecB/TagA/CpsF family glycosyltransferase [Ochrobactrum sp. XJ1]KAB2749422.1 WecB/TagA/CpsF family glycosyltransferase [Brucella anthropi]KAB2758513.1 WecB/TagA/CpsF family glycosyltransferase [Brucella anthropi]KAB2767860.1 WecB/TagA/CpsF family glycosyltransferase [Brucella anthropi]MBE0562341.1 WecB/TagA/CpsF family glycosyltransferase [Brucella anthropi]